MGTVAGEGPNVISGNHGNGVEYVGPANVYLPTGGTSVTVQQAYVGVAADGSSPLGNDLSGIYVHDGFKGPQIGSSWDGTNKDVIAFNGGSGVQVGASSGDTSQVDIETNDIYNNGSLDIDLGPQGQANCSSSPPGPNDYTPCPVILSATATGATGTACPGCYVVAHIAVPSAGNQGYGGSQGLPVTTGYIDAQALSSGNWGFGGWTIPAGSIITALTYQVLSVNGYTHYETSEFAQDVRISATAPISTTAPIPINRGWTLIGQPLRGGITTTDQLVSAMDASGQLGPGAVAAVAIYRHGAYAIYVPGYSAPQALGSSEGIFVNSATGGTWTPAGYTYTVGQPVFLHSGWNVVTAPYPGAGLSTSTIASEATGCNVQEIATVNNGVYQTWVPAQGAGGAFNVPKTSGMWMECSAATTWIPN